MGNDKSKNKAIRVVVTGGHYTPALAVIEALRDRGRFEFFWVGHKYSFAAAGVKSPEYQAITGLGISFFDLQAGKLYGVRSLKNFLKVFLGALQAFYILIKIRPRLIVSFGGYLAAPVVLAGFLLRIPSVTHEQTVVSGWANRFIGHLARKVFISWEQSAQFFPREKVVLTGNPIRKSVFESRGKRLRFRDRLPTVYITGGKQGAHVINEVVRNSLSEFLERYNVIHQTGSADDYGDYKKIMVLRNQLPDRLKRRYVVQAYVSEDEIGAVFKAADIVVSRSGANIVTEVAALGKPAIFIPIPWVSHDEQAKNAKLLAKIGAARIIPQDELSPDSLLAAVGEITANFESYREGGKKAKELADRAAADKIAAEIMRLIS